jgi:signal transduction histidine kinase
MAMEAAVGRVGALEAEIQRLQARITELQHEKAEVEAFAAVAAHELLTPVVMMDACAEAVAERLDATAHPDSCRDLETMRRGAARARLLAETLLHQARSRGREVQRHPIDLDEVLRECRVLLGAEIRARNAVMRVAELPEILGEETLISSLFGNLLHNALKYGPREGAEIVVDATREPVGWRFSVRSQGPTIPVAERESIFAPYRRGVGERRARGAGLGLAICRSIVERHGGEIGVGPAPGGGNCFSFTLPG